MNTKQKFSELLVELKTDYLNKLPTRIEEIKQTTSQKDWVRLEELYHNLKGTGKTYGFPEVSQICEAMEYFMAKENSNKEEFAKDAIFVLEKLLSSYQTGQKVNLGIIPGALNILALKKSN